MAPVGGLAVAAPAAPAPLLPADLEAEDEEERELLDVLQESLGELHEELTGGPELAAATPSVPSASPPPKSIGYGLVLWPIEVRITVAAFLPWRELVGDTLLCQAWRSLEAEDVLWQVFFKSTWPRFTRRRKAHNEVGLPWRALFRTRWAKASHGEDALEEDWLDFTAAQDLQAAGASPERRRDASPAEPGPSPAELERALRRCREELRQARGVLVPPSAVEGHMCSWKCRFHRVPVDGDAFLCEAGGVLHRCRDGHPCDMCVRSDDDCFLVCPVSGRCFHTLLAAEPEHQQAGELASAPTWDPELSMTEQYGRWFEQGYFMSEDQARVLFDLGPGRRMRRPACLA